MTPPKLLWLFLLPIVGVLAGCPSPRSEPPRPYETLALDPQRNTARAAKENEAGLAAMKLDRLDEAVQAFKTAIEADMMYGPAHNNLGKAFFKQNKLYLAAWEFSYASKLMPTRSEPHNNLGLVYERAGKLKDAADALTKARELAPDDIAILENLCRVRVRRGDRDPAVLELLDQLILRDIRPEWVAWAREQRALLGSKPGTQTQPDPTLSTQPK